MVVFSVLIDFEDYFKENEEAKKIHDLNLIKHMNTN